MNPHASYPNSCPVTLPLSGLSVIPCGNSSAIGITYLRSTLCTEQKMTPVRAPQPSAGRRYTVALVFAGCVTFINSGCGGSSASGSQPPRAHLIRARAGAVVFRRCRTAENCDINTRSNAKDEIEGVDWGVCVGPHPDNARVIQGAAQRGASCILRNAGKKSSERGERESVRSWNAGSGRGPDEPGVIVRRRGAAEGA